MSNITRLLAFDYGTKKTGVAYGQLLSKTTKALGVIATPKQESDWAPVKKWMDQWKPDALLVGHPVAMSGDILFTTQLAQTFADTLKQRFSCPVVLVDERLTTVEARSRLFERGGYKALKTASVDAVAAELILETWMNQHDAT